MDYSKALLDQTAAFGELIHGADASTPVPTCPGWTLKHLFRHVGRGNRWCAQIVAELRTETLDPREVRDGKPPEDPDAAIDWLHSGVQAILDAVDRVGPDTEVWTFLGPRPAHWWIRRRVHEATVHRADAALALGAGFTLSPELAADGIDEWIERVVAEADPQSPPVPEGVTLHLHATDDGLGPHGEWTLINDGGLSVSHSHGKGAAAVRGPATELLLAIVRRKTTADAGIEVLGDAAVWDGWLQRTPF
ncbi:MAG: hypothetical protein QOH57_5154 [Mycobacterium sp.]|nr:hypothetical protein [Mycobacterium sp.]